MSKRWSKTTDVLVRANIERMLRMSEGYCPCVPERNEDTKCPCKKFREDKVCCCNYFIEVEE